MGPYNEFVRETGGAISYNTVIDALNYLVNKKKVLNRRENPNPHYSDYEYCINKEEVRKLLKQLPEFPHFVAKGTKGKKQQAADSTNSGTGTISEDSTSSGTSSTSSGTSSTSSGINYTNSGIELYQNRGTSQKQTQNPSQSSSQGITQKQKSADISPSQSAPPSANLTLGNLSLEEIALIQEHRRKAAESTLQPVEETPQAHQLAPASKQVEIVVPTSESSTSGKPERPASDEALTEEIVIQLWEYLRGVRYEDKQERAAQVRAVRTLLSLHPPMTLSVDLLERVYNTYLDDFWRSKYGDLHLTHLVDTERSSGQRRIIRWLNRLRSQPVTTSVIKTSGNTDQRQEKDPTSEAETYVLWTRDTDNPTLSEFVNTPRGKRWYELAALIVWEGMTETEAMQYGWEPGNSMTDHETRMIAYAQQRRQGEQEVQEVHA